MGLNLNLNKKTKKLGKVTGAMFSKKRQQEYKDRNWAMDSTTNAPISPPTPKSTNPLLKSEFFPSIKAPTKIKSPKAPPKRKATKVLVKKKATAIKAPKSAGISAVSQRPKAKSVKVAKPKQGLVGKKATAPKARVLKSTKLTRSQKIRAKGEAALKSGDTMKAKRLRRRYDRVAAREAKRAGKKS